MEFQKLIEERRTIRKYSPEGKITKDELLTIIRAAQEAPSWKNSQTGRYYCVTSEDMVEKISKECLPEMNQPKAENAALIITTFVQNRSGFQKDGTPDNELGNGWGCYDLGLQNENLGLRAGDKLREILSIPETETVVAVIAIGKAAEEPARPKRKDVEDIVKFF